MKEATGVYTFHLEAKLNLAHLKADIHKIDID